MLSVMDRIRNDPALQRRMYNDYLSYMIEKGAENIWTFDQWREHFDFPVQNSSD